MAKRWKIFLKTNFFVLASVFFLAILYKDILCLLSQRNTHEKLVLLSKTESSIWDKQVQINFSKKTTKPLMIFNLGDETGTTQDKAFEVNFREKQPNDNLTIPVTGDEQNLDEEAWKDKIQRRFQIRRNHLQERCANFHGLFPEYFMDIDLIQLHYVKKYDLFVCLTPKGGSTTWRGHLQNLAEDTRKRIQYPTNRRQLEIINVRKFMSEEDMSVKMTSGSSMCVISVRHPLTRLISAYRHKFGGGAVITPRSAAVDFRMVVEALKLQDVNVPVNKTVAVTFQQYLDYVVDQWNQGLDKINPHWRPFASMSRPCAYSYKYIVMYETLKEDLQYIFDKLGVTGLNMDKRRTIYSGRPQKEDFNDYYKELPETLLRNIHHIYRYDFELFGYEVPEYIKKVLV